MRLDPNQDRAIQAAFDGYVKPPEWQPIKTAPRDGTRVLIADTDVWMAVARNWPCNGYWIEDAASGLRLNPPTHWIPLPAPPQS